MPTREHLLREAAEKELLASTFAGFARSIAATFDGIPSRPGESEAIWRGAVADRYLTDAVRLKREIADLEGSCLATAEALRRRAEQFRKTAALLPDLA